MTDKQFTDYTANEVDCDMLFQAGLICEKLKSTHARYKAHLDFLLAEKYFAGDNEAPGTAHRKDGRFDICRKIAKNVDWDNDKLAHLVETEPALRQYVSVSYKISEANYKSLPAHVRAAVDAARTEKTGKPQFTIEKE